MVFLVISHMPRFGLDREYCWKAHSHSFIEHFERDLEVIQRRLALFLSHSHHRHGKTIIALAECARQGLADTLFGRPTLIFPPPGNEKAF